jgi:hypothetical protein
MGYRRAFKERKRTSSLALLVRSPLNTSFPLLPLGINALVRHAIRDASFARPAVVAFFARPLTVGTRFFDLTTLRASGIGRRVVGDGEHVSRHSRVSDGLSGHAPVSRIAIIDVVGLIATSSRSWHASVERVVDV